MCDKNHFDSVQRKRVKAEVLENQAHFNIPKNLYHSEPFWWEILLQGQKDYFKNFICGGLRVTGTSVTQEPRRGKDGIAEQVK